MYVIVAGCGRVGVDLAQTLSYESHNVVVIDRDPASFKRLGGVFNGITIEGVAFDNEVLLKAGIEQADALAAVTDSDNSNLMTAELARNIYNVPNIITRVHYPEKELTFFKMNIDYVCSTTLTAELIRAKLYQGGGFNVQQDRLDVDIQIVDLEIPPEVAGIKAGDLDFGTSSRLITLLRGNREIYWNAKTLILAGDMVVLSLKKEGWDNLAKILGKGESLVGSKPWITPQSAIEGVTPGEVVIGGCSAVGAQLAVLMAMDGHKVSIIDTEPERFKRLEKTLECRLVEGTVYNEDALLQAGIENAGYFAAVAKKDNANLMASEVAQNVFGVPRVVARLFNRDKESTFQSLKMEYVCGTRMVSQELIERILKPLVMSRGSVCNNKLDIFEFDCPGRWDGLTVRQAWEKSGTTFAYIVRKSGGYLPEENFVLRSGDSITGVATQENMRKLDRYLHKKKG